MPSTKQPTDLILGAGKAGANSVPKSALLTGVAPAIVPDLPEELQGLTQWTLVSGKSVNVGATYWDAAYIASNNSFSSDGYYVLSGNGYTGAPDGVSISLALMSGSGFVRNLTLTPPPQPITGIASGAGKPNIGNEALSLAGRSKVVLLGAGGTDTLFKRGLNDIEDTAEWTTNGVWMTGDTPATNWPHRVEVATQGDTMIAFGKKASAGFRHISYKAFSNDTSSAWTPVTGEETAAGYIKGKISDDGVYALALTSDGDIHATGSSGLVAGITDFGDFTNVTDLDYSALANTFIIVDGNNYVQIATPPWSSAGPIPWEPKILPTSSGTKAQWVVAMDLTHTWYGIGAMGNNSAGVARFLVTKDFDTYYSVELAAIPREGLEASDIFPLTNIYLRFKQNRLFVFTTYGVYMSGQLGRIPTIYRGAGV